MAINPSLDLAHVLRRYGFLAVRPGAQAYTDFLDLGIRLPGGVQGPPLPNEGTRALFGPLPEDFSLAGLTTHQEPAGGFLTFPRRGWFWTSAVPAYRPLLPHTSFTGSNVEPLWTNSQGRTVLGWYRKGSHKVLLIGLDVAAEIILTTQGDPERVATVKDKTRFSFTFERANYLFDTHLRRRQESAPWADRLGFTVVRLLAEHLDWPLLAVLPGNARGAVLLTGDDDQAPLKSYREQLDLVSSFPITYYLLPFTQHTPQTIRACPATVEWGLHVDALEHPEDYDRICAEQAGAVRALTGAAIRGIRNHGFLNRSYLGHLAAWEQCGLQLDVNYAGLNGTALTGSFVPFRVRRPDGEWSDHLSLLTAFGDGMIFICKWSQGRCSRRINQLANQIETETPGVLVFNMHPTNIRLTRRIHRTILQLGRRPGWIALGGESYLDWQQAWNQVHLERTVRGWVLHCPKPVRDLTLLWSQGGSWHPQQMESTAPITELRGRLAA